VSSTKILERLFVEVALDHKEVVAVEENGVKSLLGFSTL